ncbi:O-methyl transferase [Sphingomonas profundi]|uniref:O-methyl transferase n=1 Tax=Alterirhizorhabdus profundi TaxID=2681549 RepID=UPI001E51176A|nr:O-methyl transferase [Sphingomonas profundi]
MADGADRIARFVEDFTREALRVDCDKVIDHDYAGFYAELFCGVRASAPRLLEIGVGGYGDPRSGGASAQVWRWLLPGWAITLMDIEAKTFQFPPDTMFVRADQTNEDHLRHIGETYGPFDVIIDDGSHRNADVRASLIGLFPYLNEDGRYVIEDTQTSYLHAYGGGLDTTAPTTANLARELFDHANEAELPAGREVPPPFRNAIHEVRFRHNILSIHKRTRSRRSNLTTGGIEQSLAEARAVSSAAEHEAGFWTRQARYLTRLGRLEDAAAMLAEGQAAWPDDREIACAIDHLAGLAAERA